MRILVGSKRIGEAEFLKCQRVGDEVLHLGVVVGARLVAQQAGRVGVVVQLEAGLEQQIVVDPVHHLLRVVELLVGIAALAEARGIADGESVARIDDDLRQLAVIVPI